jgi:hypothetical protein
MDIVLWKCMTQTTNTLYVTKHVSKKGKKNKMDKMFSINTSVQLNPFCQKMQKCKDFICSDCYAGDIENTFKHARAKYIANFHIVTKRLLSDVECDISNIKSKVIRLHAIGELVNNIHLMNYIQYCIVNPKKVFALWTKKADLIESYFDKLPKPKNLILIFSNPSKDKPVFILPKYFDKIFNVYTKDYVKEHNVKINCAAKSCFKCRSCYSLRSSVVIVNEMIKKDQRKK